LGWDSWFGIWFLGLSFICWAARGVERRFTELSLRAQIRVLVAFNARNPVDFDFDEEKKANPVDLYIRGF